MRRAWLAALAALALLLAVASPAHAEARAAAQGGHQHNVAAVVTGHLQPEDHHHGEGLFGLTIPCWTSRSTPSTPSASPSWPC